jgi:hypothetical protein
MAAGEACADGDGLNSPANRSLFFRRFARPVLENQKEVIWAVTLFPLAFVMFMALGKLFTPTLYQYVIGEDNLVEYGTCFAYLLACTFAVALGMDLHRQRERIYALLYFFLSGGLFLIAMEEISWGQRIFNLGTPEFFESYNEQSEITLHNMYGFPLHKAFVAVGFYGAFSRLLLARGFKKHHPMFVELLTPPYRLFFFFFVTFFLYAYYEYLYYRYLSPLGLQWRDLFTDESFVDGKDQEPIELLLSLGFLLFVAVNWYRYAQAGVWARTRRSAGPEGNA